MNKGKASIMVTALAIIIFSVLSSTSQAQIGKFGYIDSNRIFAEYKEWAKAQEEFNTQYKAWDDEAKEMQKEYEDMIDEYDKQKLILSAEKKKEREAAIEAKRQSLDAFTREIFGPGGTAERKNKTLVQPLVDKINAAIEQVATEGNFDFIFTSEALAYAKKDFDITDKIIELLEEE
ncbi:MAG: OmpH family outer membrane protein [Candidatus Zixiibacteriota bacterium]